MARRPTPKKRPKINPRGRRYLCEALENRKYLVVLHAGDVFEFWAENRHYERVVVTGDTGTVELLGVSIDTQLGTQTLNTMQGVITSGPDFTPDPGVEFGNQVNGGMPINAQRPNSNGQNNNQNIPTFSDTIYAMYVSQGDATTHIAVASVPNLGIPGPRNMQPFGGDGGGGLRVALNNGATNPLSAPGGIGDALLGSRTIQLQNQNGGGGNNQNNGVPILNSFARPADAVTFPLNTPVSPGLVVAQGVNLGQFLFGGMIMGNVDIKGSIDMFYGGWIITGNTSGNVFLNSSPVNFNVDGDIRYLVSAASLGTDGAPNSLGNPILPNYVTNFNMHVGGRLGAIETPGSVYGTVDVVNSPTAPSLSGEPITQIANNSISNSWNTADFGLQPGGPGFFNNDTFNSPQILGPINAQGDIVVNGAIQSFSSSNDHSASYYGVPLMAGQTITLQLTQPLTPDLFQEGAEFSSVFGIIVGSSTNLLQVGVFDPDGRLVATDYNRVDPSQVNSEPFQFTATMPGLYRIAIAGNGYNNTFSGTSSFRIGEDIYQLTISQVGNLGIGGIYAGQQIIDDFFFEPLTTYKGFRVENGDFGAIFAPTGEIMSQTLGPSFLNGGGGSWSIYVDNGDLRTVEGSSIGLGSGPAGGTPTAGQVTSIAYGQEVNAAIPNGSVGLLKATSTNNSSGNGNTGVLLWNNYVTAAGEELNAAQAAEVAIGGDFQMVEAANFFAGDLVAQGNIGSIVASDMGDVVPSYFQVNALMDTSRHGVIDSIDVANNFGLFSVGGPAITTGPGGNVRYIHVGRNPLAASGFAGSIGINGGGTIFRDIFFGGGTPEFTLYQPGETANITDDSGAVVHMTPVNPVDSVSVITYPIRGSGGAAIVQLEVTNTTNARSAGWVNITTTGGGTAEIGEIVLDGTGIPVTVPAGTIPTPVNANAKTIPTPITNPPALGTSGTPLDITITGSAKVDVYSVVGAPVNATNDGTLAANVAQISNYTNNTGGELLNMHVTSVGNLTTNGTIGVALEHNTGAPVVGLVRHPLTEDNSHGQVGEPWSYPFLLPTNMIRITGNVVSMAAAQGIGNVYVGYISQLVTADTVLSPPASPSAPPSPAAAIPGGGNLNIHTDGAVGTISGPILGAVATAGAIQTVDARGIAYNGSGAVGFGGIFSSEQIGNVNVTGIDRGAIVAASGFLQTLNNVVVNQAAILNVNVNGILDNAIIGVYSRFDFAQQRVGAVAGSLGPNAAVSKPAIDLGGVHVTGNGGIIGSLIQASHIGPISVAPSGFGMFDSVIAIIGGNGTLSGVTVGGYGIRDGFIEGGATIGNITVTGDGTNLPTTNFPDIVRQIEGGGSFDPVTGMPLDFLNDIDTYLGTSAAASQIHGSTESGVIENLTVVGSRDVNSINAWSIRGRDLTSSNTITAFHGIFGVNATQFNIPNAIQKMNVTGPIGGLTVVTGRTGQFTFAGDVADLNMTIAGPTGNMNFKSSLLGTSTIAASGPSGRISGVTVHGNFSGTISAQRDIGKLVIMGSLIGNIHASSVKSLKLTGGLGSGSLSIDTNVGTIQTIGDLGVPGNTLTVNGNLGKLIVGGNLNTNVSVAKNLGQILVAGSILSATNVSVANTITLLKVGGDVQAGAVISAHIIKKRLIRGQLLGTITTA